MISPGASAIKRLPVELLRIIVSYCSDEDVIFRLPRISKHLYSVSKDYEVLRYIFRRELEEYGKSLDAPGASTDDRSSEMNTIEQDYRWADDTTGRISLPSKTSSSPPRYWTCWILALKRLQSSLAPTPTTAFDELLRHMEYLPHAILFGVRLRHSESESKTLILLISFFFLDVSGGPGFRSRLYSSGLDMQEVNLRMAICLTTLVIRHPNAQDIFDKAEALGDLSVASWIGSAVIGSRDYLLLNNFQIRPVKKPISAQTEVFLTVMAMAAGLKYQFSNDQIAFPGLEVISSLPLEAICRCPAPFDISERDSKYSTSARITDVMEAQQLCNLEHGIISQGVWSGYYVLEQKYDLRDVAFSQRLENITFQASSTGGAHWNIESSLIDDIFGQAGFSGTMEAEDGLCRVHLVRRRDDAVEQRWHGHISPFGISGSYATTLATGRVVPGGLFWLWRNSVS